MNPYEILQVDRRADLEVIRAAYRILARRHHPDVGGDAATMAAVNEAWAILEDPMRRARHDREELRARMQAGDQGPDHAPGSDVTRGRPVMRTDDRPSKPSTATQPGQNPVPSWTAPSPERPSAGAARGDGAVLDFGRYVGWSISELGRHDPDYLLWLERTPAGRAHRAEIRAIFERRTEGAVATAVRPPASSRPRRSWFR
ncbi:MAG TPA: J domain-containing protein [Candidatus Limnocylindrales bacterium]|nr:J domain-containing protein [Candidatus Limnocylindrales bacterium]